MTTTSIDIEAFVRTPLQSDPYDWLTLPHFVRPDALRSLSSDFPELPGAGSHPPGEFAVVGAFKALVDDLLGDEFRRAVEQKFRVDLSGRPATYTLRGHSCEKDGDIHTDSKTKIITVLIYLNEAWDADGGRLRVLRDGFDIDNYVAETPPDGGALFAFRRSDRSWHGHKKYIGPRRVLQLNWVTSEFVARREQTRHRLTHRLKKLKRVLFGAGGA